MEDYPLIPAEELPVEHIEAVAPKKRRSYRGFFIKLFLVVIIAGAALFWWRYFYTYSDGYRAGILQKLSHKGNFMKTYEGELIMSSVMSTNNVALASEKFYFSVANDSIAKIMMEHEGSYVRLHYEQKNAALPWKGETVYLIDEVKLDAAQPVLPGMQ